MVGAGLRGRHLTSAGVVPAGQTTLAVLHLFLGIRVCEAGSQPDLRSRFHEALRRSRTSAALNGDAAATAQLSHGPRLASLEGLLPAAHGCKSGICGFFLYRSRSVSVTKKVLPSA